MNPNIFSDLRKPGLVPGKSLSLSIKIDSVLENNLSYNSNGDSKKLYELIMDLTGSKVMSPLPVHNSNTELADEFTHFFIIKIDFIWEKFINIAPYALQDSDIPRLWKFDTVSEEDVKSIIMSMTSKSCELDAILNTLFKDI